MMTCNQNVIKQIQLNLNAYRANEFRLSSCSIFCHIFSAHVLLNESIYLSLELGFSWLLVSLCEWIVGVTSAFLAALPPSPLYCGMGTGTVRAVPVQFYNQSVLRSVLDRGYSIWKHLMGQNLAGCSRRAWIETGVPVQDDIYIGRLKQQFQI